MKPAALVRDRRLALARSPIAEDVFDGLTSQPKRLPAHLFYDSVGAELFERITTLPEYYLTRAERSIFEQSGEEIARAAAGHDDTPFDVVEYGAGTARKSQVFLRALVRLQGRTSFLPVDVSPEALALAQTRISAEEPLIDVAPLIMHHEQAFPIVRRRRRRQLALFIGSSIGNYEHADAVAMLRGIRSALAPGSCLLLGTDRKKSPDTLIPAYDDAEGTTAAFNKNILARINRELEGRFTLDRFRHVALWNEQASRVEMHLESTTDQIVPIRGIGIDVPFRKGERIHTESSHKYDLTTVDRMLREAGFRIEKTFSDDGDRFWVHLARATG